MSIKKQKFERASFELLWKKVIFSRSGKDIPKFEEEPGWLFFPLPDQYLSSSVLVVRPSFFIIRYYILKDFIQSFTEIDYCYEYRRASKTSNRKRDDLCLLIVMLLFFFAERWN